MELNKDLLKVHVAASKDKFRKTLTFVKVTDLGDAKVAVATDSYILAETQTPADDLPREPQSVMIDAAFAKEALKSEEPFVSNGVLVAGKTTYALDTEPGNFPDYEKIMPTTEPKATLLLDPKLLKRLLAFFDTEHSIELEIRGDKEPMVIRGDAARYDKVKKTGLIMPLRK